MARLTKIGVSYLIMRAYFSLIIGGACGDALAQRVERNVKPFDRIRVTTGVDLHLRQDNVQKVSLEGEKKAVRKIKTIVIGTELQIFVQERVFWSKEEVPKVYVSFVDLQCVVAKRGADVYSEGVIKKSYLRIDSDGGSDIYMNLSVDSLYVNTNGGSNVKLRGNARLLTANAYGGSDLNAQELLTEKVIIETEGGSDAILNVTEKLNAKTSGGSDIFYYGNPKIINIFQKGSGEVKAR